MFLTLYCTSIMDQKLFDFIPAQITVFPPDNQRGIYGSRTDLFRENCALPMVLEKALENRNDEPVDLSVASVGCSYGAEIDSFLALAEMSGRVGKVSAVGFDIRPETLKIAEGARYSTRPLGWSEGKDYLRDLEATGFETTPSLSTWVSDRESGHSTIEIDSKKLRERHDVSFEQVDISKQGYAFEAFDIVLCNNVLYWVSQDQVTSAMGNLAHLARNPGSIISIGTTNARENLAVIIPNIRERGFLWEEYSTPQKEILRMFIKKSLHAQAGLDVESVGVGGRAV